MIRLLCKVACCLAFCSPTLASEWQPATITRTADGREWYHDGAKWVEVTRTQCYGGQCQPNGIYYRQVPQQQPREWSQPAPQYQPRPNPVQPVQPQQPTEPVQPVKPASWEDPRWVEWRADIEVQIAAAKGKDGRDGIDGKDGLNGKDGEPGTAEIDYDQLATKIDVQQVINNLDVTAIANAIAAELPKPPPAYVPPTDEQLAAAVQPHLEPFWMRIVDPKGKATTEYAEVQLGQRADLEIDLELSPVSSPAR